MAFNYNHDHFISSLPNIRHNKCLRLPQIEAYDETKRYFDSAYSNRNALIVVPTGVGKTGIMGLLPYGISHGRVLIITPWTTVRDAVIDSLNPDYHDNFWLKRNVFLSKELLPNVIEFSGNDTTYEVISSANIVVLNVQKLQSRLESSLINSVPRDFFDMIIIDEAHHSTAKTWVESVKYFKNAKIVKLTATPFRTDGKEINGHLVYKYPLNKAMYNQYVKSLENIVFIPDELRLTVDGDESKTCSIEEIYQMNLKDTDWVTRSVAYSKECSEIIVDESIKLLRKKIINNRDIPHKIIAIACSIRHAKQITELYEEKGYSVALLHSELNKRDKDKVMKDIENHRVQVIVNVAMLGEGYDHPYLSIGAIFRPFRNELPYAQFIGRILRYINDKNAIASDNIGQIVSHKHLGLNTLWEKYKIEIRESEIIQRLRNDDELLDSNFSEKEAINNDSDLKIYGQASHHGNSELTAEVYMETEVLRENKEKEKYIKEKIKKIRSNPNITQEEAELIIRQMKRSLLSPKRPDLAYSRKKQNLDSIIREEIVPELIKKYNINEYTDDLRYAPLFDGEYWYVSVRAKTNSAMLAMYINSYLRDRIGKSRSEWLDDDFNRAFVILDELKNFIDKCLEAFNKTK